MFKFIFPSILVGVSVALFFLFTNPMYQEFSTTREQIASYNEALDNAKLLEAEREKLTQKYNSIDPANIAKLEKLMPDSVGNIPLILEIEKIAGVYGMDLKNVKYDTLNEDGSSSTETEGTITGGARPSNKDYGVWDLEFSIKGRYLDFIDFLKDLEKNLRIVDISSITFSSDGALGTGGSGASPQSSDTYEYNFKIKTYWLKN